MQMFRDQGERAADSLEYPIRGRLVRSRHRRSERGLWAGRKAAAGYYVPFEPYAEVIRAYFRLFQEYNGCVDHTWAHIQEHGPFFPEFEESMLPEGFIYKPNMEYRSEITGKLCASKSGLRNYLTNVVYLGHWIHKQVIVEWDNHAPLVDADLFMYAFNRISKSDFHGEPNANHSPYRAYRPRQPKNTRSQLYPTYASLERVCKL